MKDKPATVSRVPKQLTPFPKGVSGNPAGRPPGSRNRLANEFIDALHSKFQEHGAVAFDTVAKNEPAIFLKLISALLPREVILNSLSVNATLDLGKLESAQGFFQAFAYARSRIGAEPPIEHDNLEAEAAWKLDGDHD